MTDHTYASAMAEAIHEVGKVVNAAEKGHDVLITAQEALSQLRYLQQQEKNQREYRETQDLIERSFYNSGKSRERRHG